MKASVPFSVPPARLGIYTIGDANVPSTRFRITQYLPLLRAQGFQVRVFKLPPCKGGRIAKFVISLWQGLVRWLQLFTAGDYDVVIIQKGLTPWRCRGLSSCLRWIKNPVIFDIDDAVYLDVPVRLPGPLKWLQEHDEPLTLIKSASHVMAGSEYLKNQMRDWQPRVSVVPTVVDSDKYFPVEKQNASSRVVVGWMGSASTNKYLGELIPVLSSLAERNDYELLVVSENMKGIDASRMKGVTLRFYPWRESEELARLREMDIGLMPLQDDAWARGKCGLKALLYMSVAVPPVCSPVGVNQEIVADGENGFWADTHEQWEKKLEMLMRDKNLRKRMGAKARKTVESRYSVRAVFPKLERVLAEVLNR